MLLMLYLNVAKAYPRGNVFLFYYSLYFWKERILDVCVYND